MDQKDDNQNKDPRVQYIRGWMFPSHFAAENIEAALDYRPLDGDIVLCSYPKTGTTWTKYIIWQILHKGKSYPDFNDLTFRFAPFMEDVGAEEIEKLQHPRLYSNHFSYDMMNINDKAKYIYVYRNPKDTLVSLYHFMITRHKIDLDFDDLFEKFLAGKAARGDYFDHVLSFYRHRNDSHVLLVSYEDLHRDNREQILKIAKFLGDDYHQPLLDDESLLFKIQEVTSFNYMQKNLRVSGRGGKPGEVHFFRKGVVGDGKNQLSKEQDDRLTQKILQRMENTELAHAWSS